MNILSIIKHILTKFLGSVSKTLIEILTNAIFTDETTFRVGRKKRKCWLMLSILNYTSILKLSLKSEFIWSNFEEWKSKLTSVCKESFKRRLCKDSKR